MAQTLLLGLGGTGSRIVNYVAGDLNKKKISINNGEICCAVLDTNDNDRQKIIGSGSGIPVIPTSKDRVIEEYFNMYSSKGVLKWMPDSPALRTESMKDGASQMRSKSRLALFDIIEDRSIHDLERYIDTLFDYRDGNKIRVMIVSSLAGGTGSGMFIQTALWLRRYFAKRKCAVTIRGIFALPDVFVNTIEDIRTDNTEIQSLYANAYGAIRELNAITKIKTKGTKPLLPVKIDNLFDSEDNQPDGQPVYDYAFFVDDISEGGSVLTQIDHYEQIIARLVYMQLYAPMHDDLYSEEDNLFKRFQKSDEPVFGSCGTSKAIYPTEDIIRYCALRASQDALSTGWKKIDEEIKEKKRREDEKEKSGSIVTRKIDPRAEYVRLFDNKAAKTGDQIGTDRLFVNISNEVMNVGDPIPAEDGTYEPTYSDKIDDFFDRLSELIDSTVDTADPGSLSSILIKKNWVNENKDNSAEKLITFVGTRQKLVDHFIDAMETEAESLADTVLDLVCPANMGDINENNGASVYGLFTKKDSNNNTCFIHPIVVRYLVYKLLARLEETKGTIAIDTARNAAEKGYGNGKKKIEFDNKRTRKDVEDDPISYLKSRAFLQNEAEFIKFFKTQYAQHNAGQHELCRTYAIQMVTLRVARLLSQRLDKLADIIEDFFGSLDKVSNTLEEAVADNVRKNNRVFQKVVYVCATESEKEALYGSLMLDTSSSDVSINKIVVQALYAQMCVKESPEAANNKKYVGMSVENTFYREVISAYSKQIIDDHRDEVDLDIYSAVCKGADIKYEKIAAEQERLRRESDHLDIDIETSEDKSAESRHQRHVLAMNDVVKRLIDLSAPFLICNSEQPEDSNEHLIDDSDTDDSEDTVFTPIRKRKTFWGFSPIVAEKCPELARILGVNVQSQQNIAYSKNELDCYRAVYGIQIQYIDKFNELKNGDYYRSYRQVVREMISGVGAGHPEELIHTPHLDKTWHLFLPYVTSEMQLHEDSKFYRSFWLAVAYGMISVGKDGMYQIARTKKTATGSYKRFEHVMYNDKPVGKTAVTELLASLKFDGAFLIDAAACEKQFALECQQLDNYENTEFLRGRAHVGKADEAGMTVDEAGNLTAVTATTTVGGLASTQEHNAVTLIVRYYNYPKSDDDVTAMMIQSLEKLCRELVSNKYGYNEDAKIANRGYELCRRIYIASTMKDKDIELLGHWKDAWARPVISD